MQWEAAHAAPDGGIAEVDLARLDAARQHAEAAAAVLEEVILTARTIAVETGWASPAMSGFQRREHLWRDDLGAHERTVRELGAALADSRAVTFARGWGWAL
jgi:hypothetical protein